MQRLLHQDLPSASLASAASEKFFRIIPTSKDFEGRGTILGTISNILGHGSSH